MTAKICLLVLFTLLSNTLQAQLFKGGIVAGANFSQIDGDNTAGFNKFGLNAGFIAQVNFNPKWAANIEILYSQKGSRNKINATNPNQFKIITDYADIPVTLKFYDPKGKLIFGGGFCIGKSIRNKYIENEIDGSEIFFLGSGKTKAWNLEAIGDFSYMFNNFFGLQMRYHYSLIPFRQDALSAYKNFGQYHHYVAVRTLWLFSALFTKK